MVKVQTHRCTASSARLSKENIAIKGKLSDIFSNKVTKDLTKTLENIVKLRKNYTEERKCTEEWKHTKELEKKTENENIKKNGNI